MEEKKKPEVQRIPNHNKKTSKKPDQKPIPKPKLLGTIMDEETKKLRVVVFSEMSQTNIPASLMEYILMAVLAEVRDAKNKEYSEYIMKEE